MGIATQPKKERNDRIYEMRKKGYTLVRIAKRLNLTKQRVSKILKSYPQVSTIDKKSKR